MITPPLMYGQNSHGVAVRVSLWPSMLSNASSRCVRRAPLCFRLASDFHFRSSSTCCLMLTALLINCTFSMHKHVLTCNATRGQCELTDTAGHCARSLPRIPLQLVYTRFRMCFILQVELQCMLCLATAQERLTLPFRSLVHGTRQFTAALCMDYQLCINYPCC